MKYLGQSPPTAQNKPRQLRDSFAHATDREDDDDDDNDDGDDDEDDE